MLEKAKKTGTTTAALIVKDAVIVAADQRSTLGHIAYEEETKKVFAITDYAALTTAGVVGDCQTLLRFLKAHASNYFYERQERISVKQMVVLLANILNSNKFFPYMVQFIVAGYLEKPEIYELTPFGDITERKDYAVTGSGTTFALSILDENYNKKLGVEEGLKLIAKAIMASKKRDIYSGGYSIDAMVISKKGVEEVSKDKMSKIVENVKKSFFK